MPANTFAGLGDTPLGASSCCHVLRAGRTPQEHGFSLFYMPFQDFPVFWGFSDYVLFFLCFLKKYFFPRVKHNCAFNIKKNNFASRKGKSTAILPKPEKHNCASRFLFPVFGFFSNFQFFCFRFFSKKKIGFWFFISLFSGFR